VGYYSNSSFYLGTDTSICRDESLKLSAGYGFLNYLWSDGSGDSILTVDEPGVYSVVIDDGRCILSDSVKVGECSLLWIPNVFTPNGDKINDDFYAIGEYVQQFKMVIFNRWGQTLKTLYNIDEKWDGTYNGEICSSGVYYYVAEYEEIGRNSLPERRRITGSVALISGK
jgi:gliding motility-associated-like protein